ncbi:MAG: hypothetical protein IJ933_08975, partial [Bacteroidales bacterium]|nr:hypothetical protein [Bacteroidales bacterium]
MATITTYKILSIYVAYCSIITAKLAFFANSTKTKSKNPAKYFAHRRKKCGYMKKNAAMGLPSPRVGERGIVFVSFFSLKNVDAYLRAYYVRKLFSHLRVLIW